MFFPLVKFWRYSPIGFVAACMWNFCEFFKIEISFAPTLFGLAMGKKGTRKP